uniref:Theta defensin subunit A n=1 Tax=Papio hamadryas TaxID=9557 RepID=BTDA_PAPHA|nr:RecName: Full=Theta defensin subunit A [Papio hamadryas]
RCVCTRGFC